MEKDNVCFSVCDYSFAINLIAKQDTVAYSIWVFSLKLGAIVVALWKDSVVWDIYRTNLHFKNGRTITEPRIRELAWH